MSPNLPTPWKKFLEEVDGLLPERVVLHCIGGFAVVAAYGLPRSTNDLDYFSLVPNDLENKLQEIAGEGSVLARLSCDHRWRTSTEVGLCIHPADRT